MHRSFLLFGLVAASAGACAANDDIAKIGAGSMDVGAASASTTTTTSGGGGGMIDGGAMCNLPPAPSPNFPDEVGCYADTDTGWVAVQCLCELWLANTTFGPITTTIVLDVAPPTEVPSLDGTLDVEVAFDDPDASMYAAWKKQIGNGDTFVLTNSNGTTTVRMGQGSVTLLGAPVAACETRKAVARVSDYIATLSIHAVLSNGTIVGTTDGTCLNPPHP